MKKKIGEILKEAGLIDQATLDQALQLQSSQPRPLGQILIEMGVADDDLIAKTIAGQLSLPRISPTKMDIDPEIIEMVPSEMAHRHHLIPVKKDQRGRLMVATDDPLDFEALEDLRFATGSFATPAVATSHEIRVALANHYPKGDLDGALEDLPHSKEEIEILDLGSVSQEEDVQELLASSEQPPVVRLTNAILIDAIKRGASDIHIEPRRGDVLIRYRVDGVLHEMMKVDRSLQPAIVSRLKVISDMDLAERRKPQDGKSQVRLEGKFYDFRVSTIPTSLGEKMTIRILDSKWGSVELEDLGFSDEDLKRFSRAIAQTRGIVLVTGPTGSGKTSTLYACLNRLRTPDVNIVTVEDPVEYDVEGVSQVQINPKSGMTFASGLRSILRQDPDIVLVGEIRDEETVSIACQAAQTGHLVLSTLHTNDAVSALSRLRDLGAEPYQMSDVLVAVMAQRLVRQICPECRAEDPLDGETRERLRELTATELDGFQRGQGCEDCHFSGFSGRLGLFEILVITPEIQDAIANQRPASEIKKVAWKQGYRPLLADGILKAQRGLTTVKEVFRVAPSESFDFPGDELLPKEVETSGVGKASKKAETSSGKPQILVVDDSETIRHMVSKMLEKAGYEVRSATNGQEALQLAQGEQPDLIVTDFLMPKLNGYELIRKLKAGADTREIPVIMLTAKDDVDSEVQVIDAGAEDYLPKPVDAKRLLARVRRLLN